VDSEKKWEQAMDEEHPSHGEPDMGFGEATQRKKSITEQVGVQIQRGRRRKENIPTKLVVKGFAHEK
ncbi:hypothetical protein KI387_023693, partial [Taxus chinensis]